MAYDEDAAVFIFKNYLLNYVRRIQKINDNTLEDTFQNQSQSRLHANQIISDIRHVSFFSIFSFFFINENI